MDIYAKIQKKVIREKNMERYRAFRLAGGIGILLLMAGVFIWALFVKIPLPCVFRLATGLYCPTCGATRAIIHLVHGSFLSAIKSNAFVTIASVPTALWLISVAIGLILDKKSLYTVSKRGLISILILIGIFLIFGIVRNMPPFIWLNPS